MAKYRSELNVPVEFDRRSYSDRYHDHFKGESETHPSSASRRSPSFRSGYQGKANRSPSPWHKHFSNGSLSRTDFSEGDDWFEEMRRRFDDRRKRWDNDVRRMRQEFFTLSPETSLKSASPPRLLIPSRKHVHSQPFTGTFEIGTDGTTYFVASFEVSEYPAENIRVSIKGDEVLVTARSKQQTDKMTSSLEYSRSIKLPEGADDALANATLTTDGVLTFTCPMRRRFARKSFIPSDSDVCSMDSQPSHSSLFFNENRPRMCERSRTEKVGGGTSSYSPSSPSIRTDCGSSYSLLGNNKPRFRLELPIDSEYSPAEIQIRTLNRRIYVTARHEERRSNRTAVREFSKEYDIPDNIDPESLEARLDNGTLYIEAVLP
ncbi:hypothetical protein EG68_01651 [Paragonimus skrjabini miyazakii]|uniref:SHSP domain-containing protein n=1 Tax=Paragonimus skrjabini miyazakii TaxID=59628 RepID=A0A8S9ZAT6_9TREM|nr:hypothetical protein EG68_01651 [Paragonimus skrjabini miyazakii]